MDTSERVSAHDMSAMPEANSRSSALASRCGPGGRRWFLVHAQTGREELARLHLERQAYRTFLPAMQKSIRHARQIRSVKAAFFPGYLFVSLDPEVDRWRSINGTIGVISLVKAAGRPTPAPEGLVEALMAQVGAGGVLDFSARFAPGDRVRVVHGPFVDQFAEVAALGDGDRVKVLLSFMHQLTPVEVRGADLVAV